MTSAKKVQYYNIPFLIDEKAKIVKSVTKYTTCNDVINKLPKTDHPLAVFQTVSGEEKELAGKTKLLKLWRSHGSSKKAMFVVKASEGVKEKRLSLNIFGSKNRRKSVEAASKDRLKQVTDLAFYIQYQKSKLQKITEKNEVSCQKGMQKMKSTSSVDSMDAFLAKADLQKMGQFLDFCSGVTSSQLGDAPIVNPEPQTARPRVNKNVIRDSLKTMKLGFKRTFTSKVSIVSKSTSASTIKSTDTGYQSHASDMRRQTSGESRLPKRHTFIDADLTSVPRHSTPVVNHVRPGLKRNAANDTLDVTLKAPKIANFDEEEGKYALMTRFMADTTVCAGTRRNVRVSKRRRNTEYSLPRNIYASAPVLFQSQEEKCRFYWNHNCDSDSDSSCSDSDSYLENSDLDAAFVEDSYELDDAHKNRTLGELSKPTPKKLRRESAVSNLNMFDMFAKPFDDTVDSEPKDTGFNYSFDCTFPEFSDSQDFSVDYSCSETESDLSSSFEENYFTRVKDDDFDSFMKSTLSVNEKSKVHDSAEKKSDVGSDEGVGSMASDSFSDDGEIFI